MVSASGYRKHRNNFINYHSPEKGFVPHIFSLSPIYSVIIASFLINATHRINLFNPCVISPSFSFVFFSSYCAHLRNDNDVYIKKTRWKIIKSLMLTKIYILLLLLGIQRCEQQHCGLFITTTDVDSFNIVSVWLFMRFLLDRAATNHKAWRKEITAITRI